MLIRSTPSSADPNTSDPIACRAFWLVQLTRLRYTPLKPPRHLHIVANKRCLLLLCAALRPVSTSKRTEAWSLAADNFGLGGRIPCQRAVTSALTISVPDRQTLRTPC